MYLVSGGFSAPCMVVNSIMSRTTNAMGFYTGHFGHMTKHACVLHEYPRGFVLSDDRLSIFDDRQSFHHMALFTFHPNIQVFHLQPIRSHEASTQHMAIRKVFYFFRRKSIS